MNDLHLHLTVLNRILIHLNDYKTFREEFEVPFQVTQAGIASAIKIQQKHLPRSLKKLKDENYIEERMTHVTGVKQKRKVYFLSEDGVRYAWELINNLNTKEIPIAYNSDDGGANQQIDEVLTLEELYNREKNDFSLINILIFLDETGVYDRESLKNQLERRAQAERNGKEPDEIISAQKREHLEKYREIVPETERVPHSERLDIYHTALKQAWQDGQITKDERDILTELQEKLGITGDEHNDIEKKIMAANDDVKVENEEIYKAALKHAWIDGIISDDEDSLLKELRRTLKITDEQHKNFEKELKLGKRSR